MSEFLSLDKISSYRVSFDLANYVWDIVTNWDYFAKRTVGSQFIEATDSISANIAEGFGRYHKKDKIKFYYNARGSVQESFDWLEKARIRKLLKTEEYEFILAKLRVLPREINTLIKFTVEKLTI